MYKMKFVICLALIVSITSLCSNSFADMKENNNNVPKNMESVFGEYIKDMPNKEKNVEFHGDSIKIKYKKTFDLSNQFKFNKSEKGIKKYDIYADEANREYIFLEGTNKICGIKDDLYYGSPTPKELAIPEKEAIKNAEEFLKSVISEFSQYSFVSCEYQKLEAIYAIRYSKKIMDIYSDDVIAIYVKASGDIGGFSAFNRGSYDNCDLSKIDINKGEGEITKIIDKNKATVKSKYISYDENGKLCLVVDTINKDSNGFEVAGKEYVTIE